MYRIVIFLGGFLVASAVAQFPGFGGGPGGDRDGPRPLPMPALPGFSGRGGMMNPFLGPQQPNRNNMPENNNNRNGNNNNRNTNSHDQHGGQGQQRSSDSMLDQMGLQGIQPFYASLTSELTRTPTGMGMGVQDGAPGANY